MNSDDYNRKLWGHALRNDNQDLLNAMRAIYSRVARVKAADGMIRQRQGWLETARKREAEAHACTVKHEEALQAAVREREGLEIELKALESHADDLHAGRPTNYPLA